MTRAVLRIGVATDGGIAAWQARCIESLGGVPGVHLDRWIRLSASAGLAASGMPSAEQVQRLRLPAAMPPGPGPDGPLDVLLDLTRDGLASPLESATEVWHFAYMGRRIRDPMRAALLDYIRTPGRSTVALVAEPGGRILRDGMLSWVRGEQLDRILFDPSDWPSLVARDRLGGERTDSTQVVSDGDADARRVETDQSNSRDVWTSVPRPILEVAALGRRILGVRHTLTRHDDWNIGIVPASIDQFVAADVASQVGWRPRRPGHFAADPFGVERDGLLHVFFEDYDQSRGRGLIAHATVAVDGTWSETQPVLDPGVHASYPFIIEHDQSIFMLPETSAAAELVLYEAVDFPFQWRPVAPLLRDVRAVDASVVWYEERWWMFATLGDRGPNNNLFAWHAPQLTGPWTEHSANPVKTDARSARPGGTPFVLDGTLYRPSQDGSGEYGGSLVLNRVDVLTTRAFEEHALRAIRPPEGSPYRDGLHTLSAAGSRTLVDGNVRHRVTATQRLILSRRLPGRLGRYVAG